MIKKMLLLPTSVYNILQLYYKSPKIKNEKLKKKPYVAAAAKKSCVKKKCGKKMIKRVETPKASICPMSEDMVLKIFVRLFKKKML